MASMRHLFVMDITVTGANGVATAAGATRGPSH